MEIQCLPTQPINAQHGVRLAVSLNDSEPRIMEKAGRGSVLENVRRMTEILDIPKPGRHVLKIWIVDPGVIVDRMVLYTQSPRDSYLGPPESCYRAGAGK